MKIAMLIGTSNWTGAEQHVLYLAQGLKVLGHEVTIVCRVKSQIAVRAKANFKVLELPLSSAFDIWSVIRLALFVRQQKIEIIHTHHNKVGWIALAASVLAGRGQVLNTIHMVPRSGKNDRLHRWYYNQFAAIICPSDAVRKGFLFFNRYIKSDKLVTIYLGIDTQKFAGVVGDTRTSYGFDSQDFVVGHGGRVSADKGTGCLCTSIGLLANKRIKLLVAGPEEKGYFKVVNEIIERYDIRSQVKFLGSVDNMATFYAALDIFAMPSEVPEAFGQAPCEAMACGKPVILSDFGALPEIIIDGQQGYIVEKENAVQLADKIDLLYLDTSLRKRIGRQALEWVNLRFTTMIMTRKTFELYEKVLRD